MLLIRPLLRSDRIQSTSTALAFENRKENPIDPITGRLVSCRLWFSNASAFFVEESWKGSPIRSQPD